MWGLSRLLECGRSLGRLSPAPVKRSSYRPKPSSPAASATMRANRPAATRPEVNLRSELHRRGLRFRKNWSLRLGALRTTPDVVFTRHRLAVYVDGCFWHSCPQHRTSPKANRDYWEPKLKRNRERDREVTDALRAAGWAVLRFWEHEPADQVADLVVAELSLLPRPEE